MTKEATLEEEFMQQLKNHQGIVHKICFIYSKTKTDREDLYQEIILQLWKSFPTFGGRSSFSTWMYRVALNTAISTTKKFWFSAGTELPDIAYEDENMSDMSEDIRILYKSISKLAKIEKAIILLWLENKSYEEIAQTMGISVKNVSVKLVRIKASLSEIIKNMQ